MMGIESTGPAFGAHHRSTQVFCGSGHPWPHWNPPIGMSNSADVAQLYKNVIEEVIKSVKNDFINMGIDEQVLVDLQQSWEQKLIDAHVFNPLHYPITTTREFAEHPGFYYGIPPAVSNFPVPTVGAPMSQVYASAMRGVGNVPPALTRPQAGYHLAQQQAASGALIQQTIPQSAYSSARPQRPDLSSSGSLNVLAEAVKPSTETGIAPKNTHPQLSHYDGSNNIPTEDEAALGGDRPAEPSEAEDVSGPQQKKAKVHSLGELGTENAPSGQPHEAADTRTAETKESLTKVATTISPVPPKPQRAATVGPGDDKEADELNSDLDDEEDAAGELDEENVNDLMLCQYEKISRVRTRWRGVLRAGTININGMEYAFSRANMDFDW